MAETELISVEDGKLVLRPGKSYRREGAIFASVAVLGLGVAGLDYLLWRTGLLMFGTIFGALAALLALVCFAKLGKPVVLDRAQGQLLDGKREVDLEDALALVMGSYTEGSSNTSVELYGRTRKRWTLGLVSVGLDPIAVERALEYREKWSHRIGADCAPLTDEERRELAVDLEHASCVASGPGALLIDDPSQEAVARAADQVMAYLELPLVGAPQRQGQAGIHLPNPRGRDGA